MSSSASVPLLSQTEDTDLDELTAFEIDGSDLDVEVGEKNQSHRGKRKSLRRRVAISCGCWRTCWPLATTFALGFVCCALSVLGWTHLSPRPHPPYPYDRSKIAVMIEKRNLPVLVPVLLNFLVKVPEEWPFQVWCGRANMDDLQQARLLRPFIDSGRLTLTQLPNEDAITGGESLSRFLTKPLFWELLAPAKTIFFFQPDSLICSHSNSSLDDFLGYDIFDGGYDWMGAPWDLRGYPAEPWGGNGGFSIRRRETMLNITKSFTWDEKTPEDVWFADRIAETTKRFPTQDIAMTFSFESLPSNASNIPWAYKSYGIHIGSGWPICRAFHDWTHIRTLLQWCPDAKLVVPNECIPPSQ